MLEFLRREPLYHYPMDHFSIKSPLLYRGEHRVVHVGGGPGQNHPLEINLNLQPLPNVEVVADATRLPFADESVDVIISNAVLEHVRSLEGTVGEMRRVLKPGGLVYIEIPFLQHYHTHDSHGVRFEDYRRLTKVGLTEVFDFCTPLDVGVCVGPMSTVLQILFSFVRDLFTRPAYRGVVDRLYCLVGNALMGIDRHLSEALIRRSTIPSGIYFFGRKRDEHTAWLESLPWPNSVFPTRLTGTLVARERDGQRLRLSVTNTGPTTWLRASRLAWGTVQLGVQRITASGLDRDFSRRQLDHDVVPGESFETTLDLALPADTKAVKIDLVAEGVTWFEDRGSRPLLIPLAAN